jgi:hypothetical protein
MQASPASTAIFTNFFCAAPAIPQMHTAEALMSRENLFCLLKERGFAQLSTDENSLIASSKCGRVVNG